MNTNFFLSIVFNESKGSYLHKFRCSKEFFIKFTTLQTKGIPLGTRNKLLFLSKNYFIYTILKAENIRHSKDETICPICASLTKLSKSESERESSEDARIKLTEKLQHKVTWNYYFYC